MKIGFFLSDYPVFSETFVLNELYWLQKSGVRGKIWYEVPGDSTDMHPVTSKIIYPIQKVPSKILNSANLPKIIWAHFYWLLTAPKKYLLIWWMVAQSRWWRIRDLIKAPLVALQVKKFRADLLYVHEADNSFYFALLSAKLCGIPLGIIFHTYYIFYQNKFLAEKIHLADFVIFQSKYSRQYVKKQFNIRPKHYHKLHVVSSAGVNTDFFKRNRKKTSTSKTMKIITIGRLEESKGFRHLILAISLLKTQGFKIKCQIIGYGFLYKKFKTLRDSLNLTKEIDFLGKIPHTRKLIYYLSQAEIFILPSIVDSKDDRDMQPNVVKEAMAMKLLTIASDLGGIREVITPEKNGFLLSSVSAEHIADKLKYVWQLSTKEKQHVVDRARKTILNKYQAKKINSQLLAVFNQYVEKE